MANDFLFGNAKFATLVFSLTLMVSGCTAQTPMTQPTSGELTRRIEDLEKRLTVLRDELSAAEKERSPSPTVAVSEEAPLARPIAKAFSHATVGHVPLVEAEQGILGITHSEVLLAVCPDLNQLDWERFTFEMEAYVVELQDVVNLVYRRS